MVYKRSTGEVLFPKSLFSTLGMRGLYVFRGEFISKKKQGRF